MRTAAMLVIQLMLLIAPLLAFAQDAPLLGFVSRGVKTAPLRAPDASALSERGPSVSATHAVSRLLHARDEGGVPELCKVDAIMLVEADSVCGSEQRNLTSSSTATTLPLCRTAQGVTRSSGARRTPPVNLYSPAWTSLSRA